MSSQVKYANVEALTMEVVKQALSQKLVTLSGVFSEELAGSPNPEQTRLVDRRARRLKAFLATFFKKYDRNSDGTIDKSELVLILRDLNIKVSKDLVNELMTELDKDKSGTIGE